MTGGLGAGVLVGREPSEKETARPVRLRLFWLLLGIADTLDSGTDDIVLIMMLKTIGGNVETRKLMILQ